MGRFIFFRRSDCLTPSQAQYWKDLLYRTVKVGVEVEFALPKGVRKKEFMPGLVTALEPSRDLGRLGRHGVLDVISEHCGIEIQVIGRQPYFPALLDQLRGIVSLLPAGIRARPTCGQHFHVLTVGLTEPTPEIIVANLWNLTRRYAPELRFLTSCGPSMEAMCRRRGHCSHLEMVRWSPGSNSMEKIKEHLHASHRVPEHQNFLNLEHLVFETDGSVRTLHYENRFPDADLCPTSIVAKVFLFLALLLEAVVLSQHGVLHVGKIREWRRKVDLLDMLSNNDGELASSDTSRLDPDHVDELRAGCFELLELLGPVFARLARAAGESGTTHPAMQVLELLARSPISLMRARGCSWVQCEQRLQRAAGQRAELLDEIDRRLMRVIELAELCGLESPGSWKRAAARELLLTAEELESHLGHLDEWHGVLWDRRKGAMTFRS